MEVTENSADSGQNYEFRPNSGEAKTENYKNEIWSSELCF